MYVLHAVLHSSSSFYLNNQFQLRKINKNVHIENFIFNLNLLNKMRKTIKMYAC